MAIKLEPKRHFRHFCFCLGLRLGTSIISALWVTGGVVLTIVFAVSIKRGKSMDAYHYKLSVAHILGAILGVCVGAFGLYGSANKFTGKSVKLYKISAWTIQVGIWCTLCLARIALSLTTRGDYYSWCYAGCTEQGAAVDAAACSDKCQHNVSIDIMRMFIEVAFTVAFNVYSTLIVSAYTKQLLQKRETMRLTKRDSLASTVPFHYPPSRNNSLFKDQEASALEMKELQTDFFPSPRTSIIRTPLSQPKSEKHLHVPSIYHPNYTAPYKAPFVKSKRQDREAVTPVDTDKDFQFWTGEEEEANEDMETITIDNDHHSDIPFDTYHYKIGMERNKKAVRSPPAVIVSPASPSKEYEIMPDSWGVQEQQLSLR